MQRRITFSTAWRVRCRALVCALAWSSVTVAVAGTDATELDGFVTAAMQRWNIPGLAIAVVQDDQMVFARGYGVREAGQPGQVDADTTFGIGSVTKSFTAAASAMLVDDGKLAWDRPVIDYLPQLHFFDPWITGHAVVRDLTSHRLGIDESALYFATEGNLDRTLQAVRYMRPAVPFRTFLYSNTGYALLGKAIEQVAGRSWDDFIATRIFQPLGMTHSSTSEYGFIDARNIARCWLCAPPAGAALGYAALRNPSANVASPHGLAERGEVRVVPWRSERSVAPTGLIHSSARDMAQWMMLHLGQGEYHGRRLISQAQLQQLHAPQIIVPATDSAPVEGFRLEGYGMGWFVGSYRGLAASQHGGGRVGFGSQVWLFPEKKLGVVMLQNLDYREGPPLSMIAMRFADHYLGLPHADAPDIEARERMANRKSMGARQPQCSTQPAIAASTNSVKGTGRAAGAVQETGKRGARLPSDDAELRSYVGTYRNGVLGEARVTLDRGQLVLAFQPGAQLELQPLARPDFIGCFRGHEQQPTPISFTHGFTSEVSGFVIGGVDPRQASSLGFERVR